jgi:hypothetical protein
MLIPGCPKQPGSARIKKKMQRKRGEINEIYRYEKNS